MNVSLNTTGFIRKSTQLRDEGPKRGRGGTKTIALNTSLLTDGQPIPYFDSDKTGDGLQDMSWFSCCAGWLRRNTFLRKGGGAPRHL